MYGQKERPIDIYNNKIIPKIKMLDIYLKSNGYINVDIISKITEIKICDINNILNKIGQNKVNSKNILQVLIEGESFICEIMKKEIKCGSPSFYSPKQIAYIYDIEEYKVINAYKFLGVNVVNSSQISAILIQIT